ncbi:MAG: D-alanine--D-alanine ligase family protein [Bdellovibrionales bacterium]
MKKLRVGILFGGRSGEHEVSIASAMSVYKALDKSRYDAVLIGIDKTGRWLLPDTRPLLEQADNPMHVKLAQMDGSYGIVPYPTKSQIVPVEQETTTPTQAPIPHVDVILPILHGNFGEDGTMQGLLELAQIPYVGSGVVGSALGMDKDLSSRLFAVAGISVVPYVCVRKHEYEVGQAQVEERLAREFSFPFFIKPANAGSSVGVHKVKSRDQIRPALEDAFSFDLKVLVQRGIDARELEVSVLGNENPRASIVGEVIPRHEYYSYEAKYIDENGAELCIPAKDLSDEITRKVQEWALKAFETLECRGLARVDFFLDRKSGELFLNEINTIPGFTRISMYPKLWEASGLSYTELLDELIRLALEGFKQRQALRTSYEVKALK